MFVTLDGTVLATWQVHEVLDALVDEDKSNGAYDDMLQQWFDSDQQDYKFDPSEFVMDERRASQYDAQYRDMVWEEQTYRFENDLEGWIENYGEYRFFNDRGDIVADTKALHAQATLLLGLHPFATLEAVIENQRVVIRATGRLEAYQLDHASTTVFAYVNGE